MTPTRQPNTAEFVNAVRRKAMEDVRHAAREMGDTLADTIIAVGDAVALAALAAIGDADKGAAEVAAAIDDAVESAVTGALAAAVSQMIAASGDHAAGRAPSDKLLG